MRSKLAQIMVERVVKKFDCNKKEREKQKSINSFVCIFFACFAVSK
jgi:hypothetical protein